MIDGFEEITKSLSDYEIDLAKNMAPALKAKVGTENAVTSKEIIDKMTARGYNINGARLRKIINFIRIKGLVKNLIASSKGYYVENDPDKVLKYRESLIQRAEAIRAVAKSFD